MATQINNNNPLVQEIINGRREGLANQDLIDIVADGEYATTITGQYGAEIGWDIKSKDDRGSGGGSKRGKITTFPPMPKLVGRRIDCPNM